MRYNRVMVRLTTCGLVLGFLAATAAADATLPKAGEHFPLSGSGEWPAKPQWLYAEPSASDAAGKVVIHWFCKAKLAECADDLARIVTFRDGGHAYIVAYIDGNQRDAKK